MRQERRRRALGGAFGLALLALAAGYEVHENAGNEQAPAWADLALYGYPVFAALVTAGLYIWVSSERRGRIARGVGWGVLAGAAMALLLSSSF